MVRRRRIDRQSVVPIDVLGSVSYIDTICVCWPRLLPKDEFRALRQALVDELRPIKRRFSLKKFTRADNTWFHVMFIQQPTIKALEILQGLGKTFRILQVHVALDLLTENLDAARTLQRYVEARLAVSRRPTDYSETVAESSVYFGKSVKRGNQVVLYSDRKSKVQPHYNCLHIDWRILGASSLRNADLETLQGIAKLDHTEFWRKRLLLIRPRTYAEMISARQRELKLRPPQRAREVNEIHHEVRRARRAAQGLGDDLIAYDMLRLMNENKWLFGPKSLKLFSREPSDWMLPGAFNALWCGAVADECTFR